jgi:uncharacterized membrane protein
MLLVAYPIIPWIAVMSLGILWVAFMKGLLLTQKES